MNDYEVNGTNVDILTMLRLDASVFYEYKADDGKLLKHAAQEIEDLRKFQTDAFLAHSNIDLDIEALNRQ